MPISSGATGRVDVGVDSSITWTPDGMKKEGKLASRNCDSYLKRYLDSHPLGRKGHNGNTAGDANQHHVGPDGETTDTFSQGVTNIQQKNGGSDGDASDKPPKKSKTCTLL